MPRALLPQRAQNDASQPSNAANGTPASRTYGKSQMRINQYVLRHRYEVFKQVGDGSFGTVCLARQHGTQTGEYVAVKSMKKQITPHTECFKLRELQSLTAIPAHPTIVTLHEYFYDPESKLFHMVMEFLDQNLYQLMKSRHGKPFEVSTVKQILIAILEGLEHCHRHNYFHRDIKPENILISQEKVVPTSGSGRTQLTPPATPAKLIVKLADFGLARNIDSRPPYTSYVSTRWYRAPEVLLRAASYSAPVDMWALGAMAVEVATLKPLFPGKDEVDQVWKICEILGSPGDWGKDGHGPSGGGDWSEAAPLADKLGLTFPRQPPVKLRRLVGTSWPEDFINFVQACLTWSPHTRLTSTEGVNHQLFYEPRQKENKSSRQSWSGKMKSMLGRQPSDSNVPYPNTRSRAQAVSLIAPVKPVSPHKDVTHAVTKTKSMHAQPPQAKKHKSQSSMSDVDIVESLSIGQVPTPHTPVGAPPAGRSHKKSILPPPPGDDLESQLLYKELHHTAQAMHHLGTLPSSSSRISDASSTARQLANENYRPSYARPTMASARRASNLGLSSLSSAHATVGQGSTAGAKPTLLQPASPSSRYGDLSHTPAGARSPRRSHVGLGHLDASRNGSNASLLTVDDLKDAPRSVPRVTRARASNASSLFGTKV